MLKKINRSLIWLASWIVMPVSIVWLLCQLLRHLPEYRQADIVFHEVFMGNYGGGVQNTQIARRHHKGKKIVATFLYEPGSTHNLKLDLIYPDVLFLMIRKPCFVFHINGRKFRLPSDEIFIPIKDATSNFLCRCSRQESAIRNILSWRFISRYPPNWRVQFLKITQIWP